MTFQDAYYAKFFTDDGRDERVNICLPALWSAQTNASETAGARSEAWYETAILSYDALINGGVYDEPQGEIMADEQTTEYGDTLDQIQANIERARSLAEAENAEGLAELNKETETLISKLPSRGKVPGDSGDTWAKLKKAFRDSFRAAAQSQPQAKPKAEVAKAAKQGEVAPKTWDQFEGVQELVALGAEKTAEGVRLGLTTKKVAQEVARVTFDMWLRLPNKQELPDLRGTGDQAKKAASRMYELAGEGFERNHDNEEALESLQRAVQYQRTDVRAQWLRSLDEDSEEAATARELFGDRLKSKPKDVPYSKYIAETLYNAPAMLKGEGEKSLERYHAKKALEAKQAAGEAIEASEEPQLSPDEKVSSAVRSFLKDVQKAVPDDFENASADVKKQAREDLLKIADAVKQMITATI